MLRVYGVPAALLTIWLALHVAGAIAGRGRWPIAYALIVATPLYVGIVHLLDTRLKLGGVGHYLRQRKQAALRAAALKPAAPKPSSSASHRPALANQTVTLTTGFAAILLFSVIRFFTDLRLTERLDTRLTAVLGLAALYFCGSCVSNLLQILVLRLLEHKDVPDDLQGLLRRRVRRLNALAWHALMTPVILLLLLLEPVWPAVLVNAFYGAGLFTYYFSTLGHTAPEPSPRSPGPANPESVA